VRLVDMKAVEKVHPKAVLLVGASVEKLVAWTADSSVALMVEQKALQLVDVKVARTVEL